MEEGEDKKERKNKDDKDISSIFRNENETETLKKKGKRLNKTECEGKKLKKGPSNRNYKKKTW